MPVCNLPDLPGFLGPRTCLLGLDPGSVVLGIAISDPGRRVASPLLGLERAKFAKDAAQLATIIQTRTVGGIICGLPKNMDGSEGPSAQAARSLISNLFRAQILDRDRFPVVFWDERMSSAAVTRFMLQDDMTRKKRDAKIDAAAAAYILQGALDALLHLPSSPIKD